MVDPQTGTESLYNFGSPVQSDLYLRLHWKALTTYYIRYDPMGGALDTNDSNEDQFKILDDADYADNAWVVVSRTIKTPPAEQNFVGWRIKGDASGKLYFPGQAFAFNGSLAEIEVTEEGKSKRYMTLEAVYQSMDTAGIIYDANGGSLANDADPGDGTFLQDVFYDQQGNVTHTAEMADEDKFVYDQDTGRLTVFNLMNNTQVRLSNGTGFTYEKNGITYEFAGWNTQPDGSGTHFEPDSTLYYVDTQDDNPVTLYAEWKIRVYFDKNNTEANWGGDWTTEGYTLESGGGSERYSKEIYLNSALEEPSFIPISSNTNEEMFQFWSPTRYTQIQDNIPFDFSQPITQALIEELGNEGRLVLFAAYDAPIKIPVHGVDSSNEALVLKDSEWRLRENLVINSDTSIDLNDVNTAKAYVDPRAENYKYAFACVSDSLENVAEENKIDHIYYNQSARRVYVRYADGRDEPLPSDKEVYLVYYTYPATVPVNYAEMATNGNLQGIPTIDSAPREADVDSEYIIGDHLTTPLYYPTDSYRYYSYAIGKPNAQSSADLRIITLPADSNGNRRDLRVKDTWRGFQYSVDGGETWVNAGYDIEIYAIYYKTQPTVINLHEKTIGFEQDLEKEFVYHVNIQETSITRTGTEYYYLRDGQYNPLDPGTYTQYYKRTYSTRYTNGGNFTVSALSETKNTYDVREDDTVLLSDGQQESFTLFYTDSTPVNGYTPYSENNRQYYHQIGNSYYPIYQRAIDSTITSQTITFTQVPESEFTTSIEDTPHDGIITQGALEYTYTTPPVSTTQDVTYINQRTPIPLDVHVALMIDGTPKLHDDDSRSNAERTDGSGLKIYEHMIELGEDLSLADAFDKNALLDRPDKDDYVFAGDGKTDADGRTILVQGTDITEVNYKIADENPQIYELYLNSDRSKQLVGYDLYYVYYKRPKITYWYEDGSGNLTRIEPIARNGSGVTLNGGPVIQDNTLYVDGSSYKKDGAFVLDQSDASLYWVPPNLDYQDEYLAIDYTYIGIGNGTAAKLSELQDYSDSKRLWLDVEDGVLKYRLHKDDPAELFHSDPVVYVIYKGSNELTIRKSLTSMRYENGNPTFQFRITQTLDAQNNEISVPDAVQYVVSIPFSAAGSKSVTLTDLPPGAYLVEELPNINYEPQMLTVTVGNGIPAEQPQKDRTLVTLRNATHLQCAFRNSFQDIGKKTYQTFADNRISY